MSHFDRHIIDGLLDQMAVLTVERDQLRAELAAFRCAVEHVTENGKTVRSLSASEGWAMIHAERLSDLEICEEQLTSLRAELAGCKRDAERYRRLCSLVAWGTLGVCRVQSNEAGDDYADDGVMLDAWLDDPEMIAEVQGIDAAMAGGE